MTNTLDQALAIALGKRPLRPEDEVTDRGLSVIRLAAGLPEEALDGERASSSPW